MQEGQQIRREDFSRVDSERRTNSEPQKLQSKVTLSMMQCGATTGQEPQDLSQRPWVHDVKQDEKYLIVDVN
jgi:hypothetical protein